MHGLPALHDVGHLAEYCPSHHDLRKDIPNLCHRLTKVHVTVYLFNDMFVYGDRGSDAFSMSINMVLLRFMLSPTGLVARRMSVRMLSSSSGY